MDVVIGVAVIMWVIAGLIGLMAWSSFKSDNGSATGCVSSIIGMVLLIASLVLIVLGSLLFIAALTNSLA